MTKLSVKLGKTPNFDKLLEGLKNSRPLLQKIQQIRRESFYDSIAQGRDARGKKVKPLSDAYARKKQEEVGSKPIRVKTGQLVASYGSSIDGNRIVESVSSSIATYVDKDRQLLPRSWEEIPSSEQRQISNAQKEYADKLVSDL